MANRCRQCALDLILSSRTLPSIKRLTERRGRRRRKKVAFTVVSRVMLSVRFCVKFIHFYLVWALF